MRCRPEIFYRRVPHGINGDPAASVASDADKWLTAVMSMGFPEYSAAFREVLKDSWDIETALLAVRATGADFLPSVMVAKEELRLDLRTVCALVEWSATWSDRHSYGEGENASPPLQMHDILTDPDLVAIAATFRAALERDRDMRAAITVLHQAGATPETGAAILCSVLGMNPHQAAEVISASPDWRNLPSYLS